MKINYSIPIFSLLITILFTGVFRDDEFYEPYIFLKHRPTFKLLFISPIGMSDKTLDDLSPEMQNEELMFEEFVIHQGVQYPGNHWLSFIPVLLIQLTLSLFTIGLLRFRFQNARHYWKPLIHYMFNLMTTTFGLAAMLTIDHLAVSIGIGLILISINGFSFYILVKKEKIQTLPDVNSN